MAVELAVINYPCIGGGEMAHRLLNRISEVMGRKRMKIADLSREANIAYMTAHALYHGTARGIQFSTLLKVCAALDVDVGDLFQIAPDGNGDH